MVLLTGVIMMRYLKQVDHEKIKRSRHSHFAVAGAHDLIPSHVFIIIIVINSTHAVSLTQC